MSNVALARPHHNENTNSNPTLSVISSQSRCQPLFQWDATQNLSGYDALQFRQIFPPYHASFPQLSELPEAGPWAANLAVGIMEILGHYRPASQLQRWVLPQLYDAITTTADKIPITRERRPNITAVQHRACAISERIVETCVIVSTGKRKRAVSIRLEGHNGRWVATALEIL